VLEKQEKKNQIKIQNRKKNDKSNEKSVHPSAKRDGNLTIYLKNLSQLFGTLFWCDSSTKIFQIQNSNSQLSINFRSHAFCA